MKWFKHDADANADAKLQNVLLDYGLEGYGLYWYCIELIAGKVDVDNLNFNLEHDARIIAKNTGSTLQKVEQMMKYFVKIGLFECSENVISCFKMAKRLDKSMTSNPSMRELIHKLKSENHDGIMTESDSVMQDKIRLDKTRTEKKEILSSKPDCIEVIEYLNSVTGSKYKATTASHAKDINGRLSQGHSVEDMKLVIDFKNAEWKDDAKMSGYLRPATLFGASKFDGYLKAAKTVSTKQNGIYGVSKPIDYIPKGFS